MKEFWVYTLLRVGLFLGSFAIVFGVWFIFADDVPVLWVVVIAFVVSGVGSYFILERQREEFAAKVEVAGGEGLPEVRGAARPRKTRTDG